MHTSRRGLFLLCVCVLGRTLLAGLKCPTPIVFNNFCFGTFGNNSQIMKKLLLTIQHEIKTGRIYIILMILTFVGIAAKGCYSSKNEDSAENTFGTDEKTENKFKTPKTAIELEDESIMKGGSDDSTLVNFVFGMTKEQVNNHCKKLKLNDEMYDLTDGRVCYAIETKNFKIGLALEFSYDNEGKLYRIIEYPVKTEKKKNFNKTANLLEEAELNYKNAFGKNPLTNGTQPNAKFYWLGGDERYDFLQNEKTWTLAATKISAERKIIAYKEEIERKKQEEEILQKEILAELQIQEEHNIIKKLKRKASNNWPDDYTTQEYWINEQIEAYHYMLTIPNDDRIKKKAQNNWPLDFLTQKFWYNEQLEAKERLK